MGKLEDAVRSIDNLYRSWAVVRGNVNASGQDKFKAEVKRISENPFPYLRRIQTQLQQRRFTFDEQHGVLKTKSAGKKRPIVVSPIGNRVVQRAILNVLQSDSAQVAPLLGEISDALRTPTSVGGIPKRGVAYGIDLVQGAIKAGATHYLRSDIRDFFTKVPKSKIIDFVRTQTGDDHFADLFGRAMATELENADEIKDFLFLFSLDDVGVPQGSSLSAFAGNVVLRDFDGKMNGRNITTIRYIDDFVILGPSKRAISRTFDSAVAILSNLGMAAYSPDDNSEKAKVGLASEGFEFLGCFVQGSGVMPSKKSRQRFLADIRSTLAAGHDIINFFTLCNEPRRAHDAYVQTLARMDRKIRGWGDALSFSDNRLPFHQMDRQINELLQSFVSWGNKKLRDASPDQRRRAFGIALLKDTPARTPLESLPSED